MKQSIVIHQKMSATYHWVLIALVLFFYFPTTVTATPPDTRFFSIQLENDVFASSDDRFYTNGFELTFASAKPVPSFLKKIADSLPFYHKSGVEIFGFGFGQKMFTPEDIETRELIKTDRPYAGWLFLNTGTANVFEKKGNRERINGLILTIGVVGPFSLAEKIQKEFHRLIDSEIPQGWDNQLHNELGINVTYLHKWRHVIPLENARQFEVSHHAGLTLGNVYTYASGGLMARWGTHLKNDIGPPSISPGFPGIPAFRPNPEFNWYLFAGIEGRAVARNIFLDGNTFRDSHSVDKKHFVTDIQFGIAFHFKNMRIALSNMIRSKEFDGQVEPTQYGAINLTIYTSP